MMHPSGYWIVIELVMGKKIILILWRLTFKFMQWLYFQLLWEHKNREGYLYSWVLLTLITYTIGSGIVYLKWLWFYGLIVIIMSKSIIEKIVIWSNYLSFMVSVVKVKTLHSLLVHNAGVKWINNLKMLCFNLRFRRLIPASWAAQVSLNLIAAARPINSTTFELIR